MKKLHLFLFLFFFTCGRQLNAMETTLSIIPPKCSFIVSDSVTSEQLSFELFCRGNIHIQPIRAHLLQYIKDPLSNVNECISGDIIFEDNASDKQGIRNLKIDDKFRQPCLHRACFEDDEEIVDILLQRLDVDVNERNRGGFSALQYASGKTIVQKLLDHGAYSNNISNDGRTPLSGACIQMNGPKVQLLLAQPDINMYQGNTNLVFFAAKHNNYLLNQFLNTGKIAFHKKNAKKQTWFYIAWVYNRLALLFVGNGQSDVNSLDIFASFDDNQRKLFLNNELQALSRMHALLIHNKNSLRNLINFITFCVKSGADLQMCDEEQNRPVDTAWNVYLLLKKLIDNQSKEFIAKEIIFHALLFCTRQQSNENQECALERSIINMHLIGEYKYEWDTSTKKHFRKKLATISVINYFIKFKQNKKS